MTCRKYGSSPERIGRVGNTKECDRTLTKLFEPARKDNIENLTSGYDMKKILSFLVVFTALAGCSAKVHHVGKNIEASDVEQIKVGVHHKSDVAQILGSPTLYSLFKEDRWYYASKITETKAFLKHVTEEQNTYIVSFNKSGIVTGVKHLDLENAKDISYVSRETPTTGQDTSMLQQLFGNFGRISRSDKMSP